MCLKPYKTKKKHFSYKKSSGERSDSKFVLVWRLLRVPKVKLCHYLHTSMTWQHFKMTVHIQHPLHGINRRQICCDWGQQFTDCTKCQANALCIIFDIGETMPCFILPYLIVLSGTQWMCNKNTEVKLKFVKTKIDERSLLIFCQNVNCRTLEHHKFQRQEHSNFARVLVLLSSCQLLDKHQMTAEAEKCLLTLSRESSEK